MSRYQSFNVEFDVFHKEFDALSGTVGFHDRWAQYIIENLHRLSDEAINHMALTRSSWSDGVWDAIKKEHENRIFEKEFLRK